MQLQPGEGSVRSTIYILCVTVRGLEERVNNSDQVVVMT